MIEGQTLILYQDDLRWHKSITTLHKQPMNILSSSIIQLHIWENLVSSFFHGHLAVSVKENRELRKVIDWSYLATDPEQLNWFMETTYKMNSITHNIRAGVGTPYHQLFYWLVQRYHLRPMLEWRTISKIHHHHCFHQPTSCKSRIKGKILHYPLKKVKKKSRTPFWCILSIDKTIQNTV